MGKLAGGVKVVLCEEAHSPLFRRKAVLSVQELILCANSDFLVIMLELLLSVSLLYSGVGSFGVTFV